MNITVGIDQAKFDEIVKRFDGYPAYRAKAEVSSLNRALESGRTQVRREIQRELNISGKDVGRAIIVRLASASKPDGAIVVSRQPRPLAAFWPTQTAKGVRVTVRRSRGPEEIPHAFIATMKSGHTGVFIRTGPAVPSQKRIKRGSRKGQPVLRQQIKELYGPTVVGVLAGKPGMLDRIKKAMGEVLVTRMASQVSRFFGTK
jgi:hypothetical protein